MAPPSTTTTGRSIACSTTEIRACAFWLTSTTTRTSVGSRCAARVAEGTLQPARNCGGQSASASAVDMKMIGRRPMTLALTGVPSEGTAGDSATSTQTSNAKPYALKQKIAPWSPTTVSVVSYSRGRRAGWTTPSRTTRRSPTRSLGPSSVRTAAPWARSAIARPPPSTAWRRTDSCATARRTPLASCPSQAPAARASAGARWAERVPAAWTSRRA
mmetsp:Transcript_21631/g.61480  ORF Transcript_21631/g.61480 Transcript_21631/m.61480 type:complete len:216 (-) Transcript_21631:837-1484(-)